MEKCHQPFRMTALHSVASCQYNIYVKCLDIAEHPRQAGGGALPVLGPLGLDSHTNAFNYFQSVGLKQCLHVVRGLSGLKYRVKLISAG